MLKPLRLTTRLILTISVTLIAVISFLGYVNIFLAERQIIDTMVRNSQRISHTIVDNLERYMVNRELENMQIVMDILVADNPYIEKLTLLNKDGKVTLSTERADIGKIIGKDSQACNMCHIGSKTLTKVSGRKLSKIMESEAGEKQLIVVNPIDNKEACFSSPCHAHEQSAATLGVIKTDFSLNDVNRTIDRRRKEIIITLLIAVLVIGIVTWLFLQTYVSSPIATLIAGMRRAAGGDLTSKITVRSEDEIGQLADGFNAMISDLSFHTRELQKTRDYLLGIVENSADLIITVNPDGFIETLNRGAEKILNYNRSELIGKRIEMLFARPEERAAAIRQLEYTDNVTNLETQFLRKDGTPVDIILTLSRLRDLHGSPIGTLGISKDVTDYKRLRQQLLQSQCLAAIGETIASIIHSMKNILTSLKGGSYMIKSGFTKNNLELIKEGWDVAQHGIERVSDLATDMLNYTRKQKNTVEVSAVNDVIAQACKAMAQTPNGEKLAHLTWELAEDIPPLLIDRKALYDAAVNLISNAVEACIDREYEFQDQPWVKVRTYFDTVESFVCIAVSDNGAGMSDEVKEKIFTPFFTTKSRKGTGLGLPITLKIILEHEGIITVDTLPGRGSTFIIKLPVNQRADEKAKI